MKEGYACDDGVGLHYINEKLEKVISSRKDAKAYCFKSEKRNLIEEIIEPKFLG